MKYYKILFLLCFILIFTLSITTLLAHSCTKISVKVEKDTYTNDELLNYKVINNSNEKIYFGEGFQLEKKVDGKWQLVDTSDFVFPLIMYSLEPFNERELQIQLIERFEQGTYRIIKSVHTDSNLQKDKINIVSNEFEINSCKDTQDKTIDKIAVRGRITEIIKNKSNQDLINSIRVEGELEKDTTFDKAVVYMTGETTVYKDKHKVDANSLKENMLVEVIITGPVRESYPIQADAKEIRILK